MDFSIRVELEDVINILEMVQEDGYSIIEVKLIDSNFGDSALQISAVDVMEDKKIEYGKAYFDDGEIY